MRRPLLPALASLSLALSVGCGDEDCDELEAESTLEVGVEHFVDDGIWTYLVAFEGGQVLCSYEAPLDTTEVDCQGPGQAVVSVNGTVHTVDAVILELDPDLITFTAELEGVRQHEETVEADYQLHPRPEECGGEWRSGNLSVSW